MTVRAERRPGRSRPAVAALGGGHGLSVSLQALQLLTDQITAIVTVADDGGSSGRLRKEFDILPPGDLRMALAALCDTTEWGLQWRDALQHRFAGDGPLGGHALGNLIIASLWDLLGDPVAGLDFVGQLLGARGRVLPMSTEPLQIRAMVRGVGDDPNGLAEVIGQVEVATTPGRVESIRLLPDPPLACREAVEAIHDADWIILGPGSWFTSVMPHLAVPDLREALVQTRAHRLLTLNVVHTGETEGFTSADLLDVLVAHAPEIHFDVILVDPAAVEGREDQLREAASKLGAQVAVRPVAKHDKSGTHDALLLAAAYRDLLG
ncbi:uridine diphosphate-N-acetylglucosamine-binding protein YvcK [Yimella sp. cx-51]|uniref:gluconeogenesis factor YvcK family protein n=1 Tax=Yimella sp. cx-51 TaxID=2770551 RepID=UPI00165E26B6|nr:uridine diphosphate-N-acetylglucosamine-binding protein YvcK [Yimella sp. cx-51]MBC9957432.1 uridine diphosphate-N-acetylglucosamine-binding protein YvcK [Yimella sp. cx-51]MBD2760273.1 uridine diphosphate-N-acetylglucosamine-binding protein YvcK [Yimella sp. cx-573]QTH39329.1 uridine diphosphate-N-acetylglucosamine-binding protein YvcK [Yimella sp. cx-51]